MEGIFVIKNVSVELFSSFNGGSIGDEGCVCQTGQLLQWRLYWWSRTCLSNPSATLMKGALVIKNVSVKLFSFTIGGRIGDRERVCQTLQLLSWREYRCSWTCLSNSSASLIEGIFVIKNVSVKLFSSSNGVCIGDQERVCQTLQLLQWRVYWWSRTCLSNFSASLMEGVSAFKNVSVKLFSFFHGRSIGVQERVCQNFSFFNGGIIGDQERVCQTIQFLQWREYWWSRTCLSNTSATLMEGVKVINKVSVKLFSFFNGEIIGGQEHVFPTLLLH